MRKVIGIGETILDIIFKNNQPTAAVPGGSVFNGIISLGRAGVDVSFISETGNDKVGEMIRTFMEENNVSTHYLTIFPDGKSPVSLAFLDENNDPEYIFYKDYPKQRLEITLPVIQPDDILIFGSYYALNPVLRDKVTEVLNYAQEQGALLYYDPNFRSIHKMEAIKLAPTIIENLEYADIVRGSVEDFANMYGDLKDIDNIYRNKIQFYCPNFICTAGENAINIRTRNLAKTYKVPSLKAASTVGAGDNFNAGILFGLLKYHIKKSNLDHLDENTWDKIIQCGIDFSANACQNLSNSISKEFADKYTRS